MEKGGERRSAEIAKAFARARAEYPQYVDEHVLWERGWWNDGDDIDAIIMTYLNPPEVVLRYRLTGNDQDSEISLYERERVEMLERTDPDLIQHMQSVRARREREAQA